MVELVDKQNFAAPAVLWRTVESINRIPEEGMQLGAAGLPHRPSRERLGTLPSAFSGLHVHET